MSCAEPEFEPRRYSLRTACQRPRRCGRVVVENGRQREEDLTDRKSLFSHNGSTKKFVVFHNVPRRLGRQPLASCMRLSSRLLSTRRGGRGGSRELSNNVDLKYIVQIPAAEIRHLCPWSRLPQPLSWTTSMSTSCNWAPPDCRVTLPCRRRPRSPPHRWAPRSWRGSGIP